VKETQQLSDLQTEGICSTHEELNLQRSFIFKLEQQEDCKYDSYLRQHLTVFSDLAMDRDIDHIGVHIPNHFEQECYHMKLLRVTCSCYGSIHP
jgi:hypothetical protein